MEKNGLPRTIFFLFIFLEKLVKAKTGGVGRTMMQPHAPAVQAAVAAVRAAAAMAAAAMAAAAMVAMGRTREG